MQLNDVPLLIVVIGSFTLTHSHQIISYNKNQLSSTTHLLGSLRFAAKYTCSRKWNTQITKCLPSLSQKRSEWNVMSKNRILIVFPYQSLIGVISLFAWFYHSSESSAVMHRGGVVYVSYIDEWFVKHHIECCRCFIFLAWCCRWIFDLLVFWRFSETFSESKGRSRGSRNFDDTFLVG